MRRFLHTAAPPRSLLLRGFTPKLRIAICDVTSAAEAARSRWSITNPKAAELFAKALVSSILLSAFLKGEERSILHLVCSAPDAPISELYAECLQLGEVRGYAAGTALAHGAAPQWDGKLGEGSLHVTRVLYGDATPARSTVAITPTGNVEAELREFWERSEQREASIALDATAAQDTGALTFAGGVLVEQLAQEGGWGAAQLQLLPPAAAPLPRLRDLIAGGGASSLAAAAAAFAPEFAGAKVVFGGSPAPSGALQRVPVDFFCRCTGAGFLSKLLSAAPAKLLDEMVAEEKDGVAAALDCRFCGARHAFSAVQLTAARKAAGDA